MKDPVRGTVPPPGGSFSGPLDPSKVAIEQP